jgi:hypothetical protein
MTETKPLKVSFKYENRQYFIVGIVMTLLYAFQGKGSVLVATDVLCVKKRSWKTIGIDEWTGIKRVTNEESLTRYFDQKLRRNTSNDLIALTGELYDSDILLLLRATKEYLAENTLLNLPGFVSDNLRFIYIDIKSPQVYYGSADTLASRLTESCAISMGGTNETAETRATLQMLSVKLMGNKVDYDFDFWMGLSRLVEEVFLRNQLKSYIYRGFISYLITPEQVVTLKINREGLEGISAAYCESLEHSSNDLLDLPI